MSKKNPYPTLIDKNQLYVSADTDTFLIVLTQHTEFHNHATIEQNKKEPHI